MMKTEKRCSRCEASGEPYDCAFPNRGVFTSKNWACATLNAFRLQMTDNMIFYANDDYRSATFPVHSDDSTPGEEPSFLVFMWYKSRGTISGLWALEDERKPYAPSLALVEKVLARIEAHNREQAAPDILDAAMKRR